MIYQLDSCFDLLPISRLQTAYHSYPWRYGMTSQQITVTDGPRNQESARLGMTPAHAYRTSVHAFTGVTLFSLVFTESSQ